MRVLLIHPEDDLLDGPWASGRWDRVIDLGRAGEESYAQAAENFSCSIEGLSELRKDFREMRRVRELIGLGLGRLEDAFGLDWWELTSIEIHQRFEIAFLMGELARTIGSQDEVHVSRPCSQADVLRLLLAGRLHTSALARGRQKRGVRRYLQVAQKFPVSQLLEIFWDKTDAGYQFRGRFNSAPKRRSVGVVLLPTSYINISRTATAYAECVPDACFLLMATRRNGRMDRVPANVEQGWLREYASVGSGSRKTEHSDLVERWETLCRELHAVPEFRVLSELGVFDGFSTLFESGLEIRDAWRNVVDRQPIQAVICADDSNPSTHIPLLLAKQRGIPAIACHHGALDGRYMFKRHHADILLAKGAMEEDYLVRLCGVSKEAVEVGAPVEHANLRPASGGYENSSIVFFSEAYEVAGGRTRSFYRDILPPLADLALAEGKKLVVKLHPSESVAERTKIMRQILNEDQQRVAVVVGGPLTDELLQDCWFGLTVMSTVVTECRMRGIPCFLCAWLESWPYGYVAQFERFEAGIRLGGRDEIRNIPEILRHHRMSPRAREDLWAQIAPQRLRSLLGLPVAADVSQSHLVTKSA
jgi:hypothetical protein